MARRRVEGESRFPRLNACRASIGAAPIEEELAAAREGRRVTARPGGRVFADDETYSSNESTESDDAHERLHHG
jgi:hypothetical protein